MASPFEAEVMYSERNRKLLIVEDHKFGFHKALSCGAKRYKCAKRGCRAYLKIREPSTVIDSNLEHNHECNPALTRHNLSYEKLDKPKPLYRLKSALIGERTFQPLHNEASLLDNGEPQLLEGALETSQSGSPIDTENTPPYHHSGSPRSPLLEDSHPTIEPITLTRSSTTPNQTLKYVIKDKPFTNSFNNHRKKLLKKLIKPVNISKRSKRFTDLQTKLNIIDKSAQGLRTSDISKEYNLPWTTVDSILKNRYRYLDAAHNVSGEVRLLKSRQDIFIIMEEHLISWICNEDCHGRPLNSTEIRKMAKKIFDELKEKDPECKADFSASKGWFNRFLGRSGLKTIVRNDNSYSFGDYEDNHMNFVHSALPYENYNDAESGFEMEGVESMMMEQIPVECVLKTNGDNPSINCDNMAENDNEPDIKTEEIKMIDNDDLYTEESPGMFSKNDLEQIFKRVEEIGVIMSRDPLKNRAFMCFNAIQSACLPYKMKLEEIEQRNGPAKTDVDAFFTPIPTQTPTPKPTPIKRERLQENANSHKDADSFAPKQLSLALTASPSLTSVAAPYLNLTTSELTISQVPVPAHTVVANNASFVISEVRTMKKDES